MGDRVEVDVCVVGAGPAGSTLAARLAQLGHDVCLIERSPFPRPRLGESLTPGVLPLLEATGARAAVESAGYRRISTVHLHWDRDPEERRDSRERGRLVDRGSFDRLLLDRARALGVLVLQPANLREHRHDGTSWRIRLDRQGSGSQLRARMLADASGRRSVLRGRRRRTGCRTVALYAYWQGAGLPDAPRIEAGADAWYWGVPLPGELYNTLVFVDPEQVRGAGPAGVAHRFRHLLDRSRLMAGCRRPQPVGPVRVIDATPYLDAACVTPASIKVGDAALALDPLSSSGVQKAIQTALAGAVVVNTLLRRPASSEAAFGYYRESLHHASERHRRWAARHYASAAQRHDGAFWRERAAGADPAPPAPIAERAVGEADMSRRIGLSPDLEIVDRPCIEGDLVAMRPAIRHPGLEEPLAYLGGWNVASLLRRVQPNMTPLDLAGAWSDRVPVRSGLAIAGWLLARGILVERRV